MDLNQGGPSFIRPREKETYILVEIRVEIIFSHAVPSFKGVNSAIYRFLKITVKGQ